MKKIAFKMKLCPGCKDEYIRRHNKIWPELKKLISTIGVCDFSIFFDEETNTLFAIQYKTAEVSSQELGNYPIVQKWWRYMSDIMETNPDSSPITIPLEMVFHMD